MVNKLKLKSGFIEFKNYSSQIPAPFKIYADFECILNRVRSNEKISGYYTRKYQDYILCSFANKLFVSIKNLASQLFSTLVKKRLTISLR